MNEAYHTRRQGAWIEVVYDEDARGLLYDDLMRALQNLRLLDVVTAKLVTL